jgi:hypothetical protein
MLADIQRIILTGKAWQQVWRMGMQDLAAVHHCPCDFCVWRAVSLRGDNRKSAWFNLAPGFSLFYSTILAFSCLHKRRRAWPGHLRKV